MTGARRYENRASAIVGLTLYRTPATKFDDLARLPTISCDRARSFVALVSTEGKKSALRAKAKQA